MSRLLSGLKRRIKLAIQMLPWGEDLLLYFNARAQGIAYRGVFESHADALAAVRQDRSADYDASFNQRVAESIERGEVDVTRWLHDHDFPMLFWLSKALTDNSRVVEFGGSLGHLFYSIRDLFPLGDSVDWTILELPQAVAAGRELSARMNESRLKFAESNKEALVLDGDLFLSAGALQYSPVSTIEMIDGLENPPAHIVLHTMPASFGETFWTLQRIDATELPYRVLSIPRLERDLEARGYERVARWRQDRAVQIPFQPGHKADGYFGFYFRLR
ncbi:MAG: methyltransferase, TIGR04325 family [Pseudomonadota bacterium]